MASIAVRLSSLGVPTLAQAKIIKNKGNAKYIKKNRRLGINLPP